MKFKIKDKDIEIANLKVSQPDFEEVYKNTPDFDQKLGLGKMTIGDYNFLFLKDEESGLKVCYAINMLNKAKNFGAPQWHFIRQVSESDKNLVLGFTGHNNHKASSSSRSMEINKNGNVFKSNYNAFEDAVVAIQEVVSQDGIADLYKDLSGSTTFVKTAQVQADFYSVETDDNAKEHIYFIVAPHWVKENRNASAKTSTDKNPNTLYMIKQSDLEENGLSIDDVINEKDKNKLVEILKDENRGNAVAVKDVVVNKNNGNATVEYYRDANTLATLKIVDTKQDPKKDTENLKAWTDANYGEGKVTYSKTSEMATKMTKHKKPLKIAAAVLAVAAVLTVGHFVGSSISKNSKEEKARIQYKIELEQNNKESAIASMVSEADKAKADGAKQMAALVEGKDLFRVSTKDGKKVLEMGAISEIVANKINAYTQKEWPTYKDDNGNDVQITADDLTADQLKAIDYSAATLQGAYEYLGRAAISELVADEFAVANCDLEGVYSANLIYVVGTTGYAAGAYTQEDQMLEYLASRGVDAKTAVAAYKNGYTSEFERLLGNGEIKDGNVIVEETPVAPIIEYSSDEVKAAISQKLEINNSALFYFDNNAAFVVANDGNNLYKLDFAEGTEINGTEDLVNAIANANVTEAVSAEYYFENQGYDKSVAAFEENFAKANNMTQSKMYLFNKDAYRDGDKMVVTPEIIMVSDNGKCVTVIDNNAKVAVSNDVKRDRYTQTAIALFGDSIIIPDQYELVKDGEQSSETFENNNVPIEQVQTLSNDDGRSL